jgi:hypothetical protein
MSKADQERERKLAKEREKQRVKEEKEIKK